MKREKQRDGPLSQESVTYRYVMHTNKIIEKNSKEPIETDQNKRELLSETAEQLKNHNIQIHKKQSTWCCHKHGGGGTLTSLLLLKQGILSCRETADIQEYPARDKALEKLDRYKEHLELEGGYAEKIIKAHTIHRVNDPDTLDWSTQTEHYTTIDKPIEYNGQKIPSKTTIALPQPLGESLKHLNLAGKYVFSCRKCFKVWSDSEIHDYLYCIDDEVCGAKAVKQHHPSDYYTFYKTIINNYHTVTPTESLTDNEQGKLHYYHNGVYHNNDAEGRFQNILQKIKDDEPKREYTKAIEKINIENIIPEDTLGDKNHITFQTNALNTKTWSLEPHNPNRYATTKFDIEITKEDIEKIKENRPIDCPKWKNYLQETIPEQKDRTLLQQVLGTALIKQKLHKKGVMLVGPTDAGKSTFIEIIQDIFGLEKISREPPQKLAKKGDNFHIIELKRKLLNMTDEVDGANLQNLANLKQLLDGNITSANQKHKGKDKLNPTAEHIYATNTTPKAQGQDDAFWNRWIVIEMPYSVPKEKQNPNLPQEILSERKQILVWILKGLYHFQMNENKFTETIEWKENREKWRANGDSIERFIAKQTTPTNSLNHTVSTKKLHQEYVKFCKNEIDRNPKTQQQLTERVKQLDYTKYSKNYKINGQTAVRGFKGIRIKNLASQKEIANKIKETIQLNPENTKTQILDWLEKTENYDRTRTHKIMMKMIENGEIQDPNPQGQTEIQDLTKQPENKNTETTDILDEAIDETLKGEKDDGD